MGKLKIHFSSLYDYNVRLKLKFLSLVNDTKVHLETVQQGLWFI